VGDGKVVAWWWPVRGVATNRFVMEIFSPINGGDFCQFATPNNSLRPFTIANNRFANLPLQTQPF
jgi:hypothetical protein